MSVDDMAVYIANLGDYVEGGVKGAWFHFPLDEEEIAERIGLNGRYEEYAIHDSENFPCELEEYTSIEELNRIYELIQDFPEEVLDNLDDFISYYGDLEELADHDPYISKCCLRPFYDRYGNVCIVVDMELKGRIREALIKMILDFDIPLETEE